MAGLVLILRLRISKEYGQMPCAASISWIAAKSTMGFFMTHILDRSRSLLAMPLPNDQVSFRKFSPNVPEAQKHKRRKTCQDRSASFLRTQVCGVLRPDPNAPGRTEQAFLIR